MPNANQLRQQLASVAKDRANAEVQRAAAQREEAKHRAAAAKSRSQAERATSPSSKKSYMSSAEREERAANTQAGKAADAANRVAKYSASEATRQKELARAIETEARAAARVRDQDAVKAKRMQDEARQADRAWTHDFVEQTLVRVSPPKSEILRILYLTAVPDGSLRVDEEIRRVKAAVRASTHRDLVQIEHMPAATPSDLLDGLTRWKPHVVHFSGHSSQSFLVFDTGSAVQTAGQHLTGDLFARALGALDERPTLVVLNSCESHGDVAGLLETVPLIISMTDSIGDRDAMIFAARFYSAIAEGQSVHSAYEIARTDMLFNGLEDALVPALTCAPDVHPSHVILVLPPSVLD